MIMQMTKTQKDEVLRDLEARMARSGRSVDLSVARELAANGSSIDEIEMLMRGMFSRLTIEALIAEAAELSQQK
jgi:hypothetical protein